MDYERGLAELKRRLEVEHSDRLVEFSTLEARLRDNLHQVHLYGDNPGRRSDRAQVAGELNRLAFDTVEVSFNDLKEATAANIRTTLQAIAQSTTVWSTAFIYFSGHGGRALENNATHTYLCPREAAPDNLASTAIPGGEFSRLLSAIPAQKMLVLNFPIALDRGGKGIGLTTIKTPLADIRELIVHNPITGAKTLSGFLATRPEWAVKRNEVDLKRAELERIQHEMDLFGPNDNDKSAKNRVVFFLLRTCLELDLS